MSEVRQFEIKSLQWFIENFSSNLNEPNCVPKCLLELSQTWTLDGLKNVFNNLSRNRMAPLPLYFDSIEDMRGISTKKPLLTSTFQLMDTHGMKNIDGMQLYTCFLFLAKSPGYDQMLQTMIQGLCSQEPDKITQHQLMFIIDSMFRCFGKFLMLRGDKEPKYGKLRLKWEDIKRISQKLCGSKAIGKKQISKAFQEEQQLDQLLKYIHLKVKLTREWMQQQIVLHNLIDKQVKKLMRQMIDELEKRLKSTIAAQ